MAAYTGIAIACLFFSLTSPCLNEQSITWQRTLDTIPNSIFHRTVQSPGNVFASIGSGGFGNINKMMFVKFDQFGNRLAQSFFDTSNSDRYDGYWIENAYGSGYIIAARGAGSNGNALLMRTDANGNIMWIRSFGVDDVRCVKRDGINGYVLAGGSPDIFVIRTDSSGTKPGQQM